MGRITHKIIDFDNDRPSFSIPVVDAADDGTDYATWKTDADTLVSTTQAILRTPTDAITFTSANEVTGNTPPLNPDAQANDMWVVEFSVNGMDGGPYKISIPGADRALGLSRNGRLELDITAGPGSLFAAAFENSYRWPDTLDNAGGTGVATVQVIYVKST